MQPGPQEPTPKLQHAQALPAQRPAPAPWKSPVASAKGPNWWRRLNAWLSRLSPKRRAGVGARFGCASLLTICALCSCAVLAFGSGGTSAGTTPVNNVVVSTATSGQPQVAHTSVKATATSTAQPTATPKPKPTATPKPRPTATPKPKPTATPKPSCPNGAVNGNPWCYNFTSGNNIYGPPSSFCSYFACIGNFWNGRGYVMQCQDGMYSKSGGISGSCSSHHGNKRALLKP